MRGVRVRAWRTGRETEGHGSDLGRGAFATFIIVFLVFVVVTIIVAMMLMVVIVDVYSMTVVAVPGE